jgi:cytochrome bd-type quinol oxidase subunit 1
VAPPTSAGLALVLPLRRHRRPGVAGRVDRGLDRDEVGRQPWIVYEVMRTEEAVTGADGVPVGYAALALTYLGLAIVAFYLLRRLAGRPPELEVG